ncbi:hypothetical protein A4S02_06995 [Acetobacter ascendens]|uniref:Uncharacterized protein n=1 Tax=Acetobacter ascendens TaxID=481146 RepID=A0A1D8QW57_9PROT|nr:hypothetical protein A4S02_06995 [Acetobacter ascendens]AOW49463.1 hypothetical protein A4R89_08565 [Acetobacter ascendens]
MPRGKEFLASCCEFDNRLQAKCVALIFKLFVLWYLYKLTTCGKPQNLMACWVEIVLFSAE